MSKETVPWKERGAWKRRWGGEGDGEEKGRRDGGIMGKVENRNSLVETEKSETSEKKLADQKSCAGTFGNSHLHNRCQGLSCPIPLEVIHVMHLINAY